MNPHYLAGETKPPLARLDGAALYRYDTGTVLYQQLALPVLYEYSNKKVYDELDMIHDPPYGCTYDTYVMYVVPRIILYVL